MKSTELKAAVREKTGARHAKHLRNSDKVPAVVYGESGTKHIELDYLPIHKILSSPDLYLINLEAGEDKRRVIVQDAQYHPLTDRIMHVDFLEAAVGKVAKLRIPVHIVGTSVGVMNGGQMVIKMRHVHIEGVPLELPEFIEVDITDLDIGKSIKVSDVKGHNIVDPQNNVIVSVKAARKLEEIAPAPEAAVTTEGAAPADGAAAPAEGAAAPAAEGAAKAPAKAEK